MPPHARVVARDQPGGAGAPCEAEQLVEAERPVAASARIRRVATLVRAHELVDDRAAELLAEVERHVWKTKAMARSACGSDGIGRAAGALRVGCLGIDPEPERDADRVASRAQQRDRAVDAAAHRHCYPRLEPEQRGRHGPIAAASASTASSSPSDRGSLEQRQAGEVLGEPVCVSLGDLLPRTRRRTAAQSPLREASPKSSVMR